MKNKHEGVGTQAHYNQFNIEPIDYIVQNNLGFLEGNVVKYVTRYKLKDGIKDLKKARQYIDWLIEQAEAEPEKEKEPSLDDDANRRHRVNMGQVGSEPGDKPVPDWVENVLAGKKVGVQMHVDGNGDIVSKVVPVASDKSGDDSGALPPLAPGYCYRYYGNAIYMVNQTTGERQFVRTK